MFHRKAPKFDITDHPDILVALARMELEAYARGRADATYVVIDSLEEATADWPAGEALTLVREVIERLRA